MFYERLYGLIASLLIVLALPVSIFAQTDPANDLWRERARNITEDLIVDGSKLPPLRRAVLRARLTERWWRDDPRRATGWLTMAVETVEQVPDKENPIERRERLETAGLLLKTALRISIASVETRAQLRLDLLRAALGRVKKQ